MAVSSTSLMMLLVIRTAVYCQGIQFPSNGAVKFYQQGVSASFSFSSGIIQIFIDGAWGNICAGDHFDLQEADVVCHQFQYTGASQVNIASQSRYGTDPSATAIANVSCSSSDYQVMLQCSYTTAVAASCTDYNDVAVACYTDRIWDSPFGGQVRLVDGLSVGAGRVEIFCSEQWGTVCDDYFNENAATTVCMQLGYNAVELWRAGSPGLSNMPIWLDRATCPVVDQCLGACQSCPMNNSSATCSHSEDIYIQCRYNTSSHVIGSTISTCNYKDDSIPIDKNNGKLSKAVEIAIIVLVGAFMIVSCTCLVTGICCWANSIICDITIEDDITEPGTINEDISCDNQQDRMSICTPNVSPASSVSEEQQVIGEMTNPTLMSPSPSLSATQELPLDTVDQTLPLGTPSDTV